MVVTLPRSPAAGVFLVRDAAAYIRATTPWVHGRPKFDGTAKPGRRFLTDLSSRHLYRWTREGFARGYLRGSQNDELALTFLDLISLRMVTALRSHGVRPDEIRNVEATLRRIRKWDYPFAMEPIWAFGPHIIVKEAGLLIALARWQQAFEFVQQFWTPIHDLVFKGQQAAGWQPHTGILIDPSVMFGQPCIKGTRIASETVWALHESGDSVDLIADVYDVPNEAVRHALDWEKRLDQLAKAA